MQGLSTRHQDAIEHRIEGARQDPRTGEDGDRRRGRIGLLATPATVASGAYDRTVLAADPHVHVESVACPDLASVIESGFPFDEDLVQSVRGYCAPLRDAGEYVTTPDSSCCTTV